MGGKHADDDANWAIKNFTAHTAAGARAADRSSLYLSGHSQEKASRARKQSANETEFAKFARREQFYLAEIYIWRRADKKG